jgi:purine-binding chemotaxis protein CheW
MSDAAVVRLLLFRVGSLVCAADVDMVREILPRLETTRIPGAMPFVSGLMNVRGQLVTAVEGWRALGQPEPDSGGGGGTTVLLQVGDKRKVVGLTVDEVVDLLTLETATLEPRQALAGVDPTLVRAVGRRGSQLFVVLDTDALLAPILTS